MMQKRLKRFGGILFFCGAMLFFGCQTEELAVSDTGPESGIVHRHIDFEVFSKQFPKQAAKLREQNEKTKKKAQRGGVYDPLNDFTILTDYIFMAERDGETYFTFGISREEQTFTGLENLVLVPDGQGGFSPLLTQYNITESEKNQIAEGGEIQDLESKMAVEPLDGVDFGGVIIPRGDDGCWTMTVSWCEGNLQHPGGFKPDGSDCDEHHEIVVSFGCANEGDMGGAGPAGPGTYPGTSTPGNGTGGGGGTAPGTGNPNQGNPLDGNQDPGTGGPNPNPGGGKKPIITQPVDVNPGPTDPIAEPCAQLKKLTTHLTGGAAVKAAIANVKANVDGYCEHGAQFKKNGTTYSVENLAPVNSGSNADGTMPMKPVAGLYGSIHSHPKICYGMFSFADLYAAYQIAKNGGVAVFQENVSMLTVENPLYPNQPSKNSLYALKITNFQMFEQFLVSEFGFAGFSGTLPENDKDKMDALNKKVDDYLSYEVYNKDLDNLDRAFLKYLDMGNASIALFQANDDITSWSQITLNPTNPSSGPVIKTPCN